MPHMINGRMMFRLSWVPDGRLFAIAGVDDSQSPTNSVEVLEISWDTEELPSHSRWREIAGLHQPRHQFGAGFIKGKLVVAGGKDDATAECLNLPCSEYPDGQWTLIRPMGRALTLHGVLPLGGELLTVGKIGHKKSISKWCARLQ